MITDYNAYLPEKTWLREFQKLHLSEFKRRGCPKKNEERWKYTDLSFLTNTEFCRPKKSTQHSDVFKSEFETHLVFINGYFAFCGGSKLLPSEVILCPLSEALNKHEKQIKNYLTPADVQRFPFLSLNGAQMSDGLFLFVPANTRIETPIHLVYIYDKEDQFQISPRNIVIVEQNADCALVEEHYARQANHYFSNTATFLNVNARSRVQYYKIQQNSDSASLLTHTMIKQEQESHVRMGAFDLGGHLVRNDIQVNLTGIGAEAHLAGFYRLQHTHQHVDNHIEINHLADRTKSHIHYRGILENKSRGVFNGKVHVPQNVQQIEAEQINRNLLLSSEAEMNTKPELEIYADDVKCKHGAAIGFLDNHALFYLRARGIEKKDAVRFLTDAFAEETFSHIENAQIKNVVQKRAGYEKL